MNIKEQYQRRLDHLAYLNLDEVLDITHQYFSEAKLDEPEYPFFENPLEYSLQFYDRMNRFWGKLLREFVHTPNFRYWPGLLREDSGYWRINKNNEYHMMVSKHNTIEDVFILVHEFGHLIADWYGFCSSPLAQEAFPILMEYLLMVTYKEQNSLFETYYIQREQQFNTIYAREIIEEIGFIQKCSNYQKLRNDLTKADLKRMESFLNSDPLDIKFSYIIGEYYLEDYKTLEKRKELHQNL